MTLEQLHRLRARFEAEEPTDDVVTFVVGGMKFPPLPQPETQQKPWQESAEKNESAGA